MKKIIQASVFTLFLITGLTYNVYAVTVEIPPEGNLVPEPATALLFGIGLLGIARLGRRKK